MKQPVLLIIPALLLCSCTSVSRSVSGDAPAAYRSSGINADTIITRSLFADKSATVSEKNIQKILDGSIRLPEKLRVAIVKLDSKKIYYWNDEDYLKTQQSYIDKVDSALRQSARVTRTGTIPDMLMPSSPNITNLREAAVRMQSDLVAVFSVTSDVYRKYKVFARDDIKAFATTQLIILDVRTGLVPFSGIVTRDVLSQKKKDEMDVSEARKRIQHEAVLQTLEEMGRKMNAWFGDLNRDSGGLQ